MDRLTTNNMGIWSVSEMYCYEAVGDCFCGEAIDRLAAYEDLEEQGRLIITPCKIGDPVYVVYGYDSVQVREDTCAGFRVDREGVYIVPEIGVDEWDEDTMAVCITKEEAESIRLTKEKEYEEEQKRREREFAERCRARGLDPDEEMARKRAIDKKLMRYAKINFSVWEQDNGAHAVEFRKWTPFDPKAIMGEGSQGEE